MNISYNWLKEYLDIPLTPEETAAALTSVGLETGGIEEVQSVKGGLEGLVIGKVLTCVPHPNSDHLHITTVDLGSGQPVQIVCGAPNVGEGQYVVVATVGTTLYSGEERFTIKKSKIRGEESLGMICAEDEIGIGTDHHGIIVLPDPVAPGTLAKDYYQIKSDYILEVDITPNRIDGASHYGAARDLAAYLIEKGHPVRLRRPSVEGFEENEKSGAVEVKVENTEACLRYSGVTISGVKVAPSPQWLQDRLTAVGLRPINNIVDVTNYVMYETGQPLHCFDKRQIKGNTVVVRTLPEGTRFVTLDGVERTLSDRDLMICNREEGMCLAGVFGGLDSGVTEKTTDVFLESACFDPTWVRKTARRHGLNTDSSFRFERGTDPNQVIYVLKRAALLIRELAGGEITGRIADIYPKEIQPFDVTLSYEKINRLIGKDIPVDTVKGILQSLEIEITEERDGVLQLKVPTYRVDVRRDVDVIEDILRIYGYNRIPFTDAVRSSLFYKTETDESFRLQNLIAEQLTGSGFMEIFNNSQTRSAYYSQLEEYPESRCVRLMNPLSSDLNVMRQTLLFGGLESIVHNVNRRNSDLKFYEFGNCYYYDEAAGKEGETLSPYSEELHLGLWLTGNRVSGSWEHPDEKSSVYELKGYVENIMARLGIDCRQIRAEQTPGGMFSSALSLFTRDGRPLGRLGIVSPAVMKSFDPDIEVFYAELNWNALLKEGARKKVSYHDIPKFPPVKRDLALLVDKKVTFADIEKIAFETERKLLKDVYLFDVYEGRNLEPGKKSYAVSFILQDDEKTLTDKQIDSIMKKIIYNLEQKTGARLR